MVCWEVRVRMAGLNVKCFRCEDLYSTRTATSQLIEQLTLSASRKSVVNVLYQKAITVANLLGEGSNASSERGTEVMMRCPLMLKNYCYDFVPEEGTWPWDPMGDR